MNNFYKISLLITALIYAVLFEKAYLDITVLGYVTSRVKSDLFFNTLIVIWDFNQIKTYDYKQRIKSKA